MATVDKVVKYGSLGLLGAIASCTLVKTLYELTRRPRNNFHLRTITDLSPEEFKYIVHLAVKVKAYPWLYRSAFKDKTLLMLFEKVSLRTRVSFETGCTQMGGHAIMYDIKGSPLGKKETYEDTAKVLSRYADIIMARVMTKESIDGLADNASIPVINALDDWAHPCQMLADFQTILEKRGSLSGIVMAYYGDCCNNVTYDLMRATSMLGGEIRVVCPKMDKYLPVEDVLKECAQINAKTGGKVVVVHDRLEGARGANVIYTDSWLSYHISEAEEKERLADLDPYRVSSDIMAVSSADSIFMHCLPAKRGWEVAADVIDGPKSVVFDEAENRLHGQKAYMIWLMDRC